ncbi:MAG: 3-phosphoshikimate 1-carboxyvinyltransferase [Opitutales bacterium]
MTDPLPILPFREPLQGPRVRLPGSKSLTNRALILAALSRQEVTLEGALFSRDSQVMCECLKRLGFEVFDDEKARSFRVRGAGGDVPRAEVSLHLGNSGTSARFVTALAALRKGGRYEIDGDPAMRKRPMEGLLRVLKAQGATFQWLGERWYMPFVMQTDGLRGGTLPVDAQASSQLLSGLLMVAPFARETARIEQIGNTVSAPFIRMTTEFMARIGSVDATSGQNGIYTPTAPEGYTFNASRYVVEPDATAASYFIALAIAVGGHQTMEPWPEAMLQGDADFARRLDQRGLVSVLAETDADTLTVQAAKDSPRAFTDDFNAISDTFLTLAALAPLLQGTTRIDGIAHTRHQETDRIAAMATELERLGQGVDQGEDFLQITPNLEAMRAASKAAPVPIDTYEDHRVAMSFGILGCHDLHGDGRPWLAIRDPHCCGKTFPDFFVKLDRLRANQDA